MAFPFVATLLGTNLLVIFMIINVINNDELISQKQASHADKIKPCLVRSSEGNQRNRSRGGEEILFWREEWDGLLKIHRLISTSFDAINGTTWLSFKLP